MNERRREEDKGFLCRVARIASFGWDWIDRRQIDAWLVLTFSIWMTWRVLYWAMEFASANSDKSGIEVAAIIAAVVGPWVTMQAALVKFHFEARKDSFLPKAE